MFAIGSIPVGWTGNCVKKSCNYCEMDIKIDIPPAIEQKDRKYLTLHGITLEGLSHVSFKAEWNLRRMAEGVSYGR